MHAHTHIHKTTEKVLNRRGSEGTPLSVFLSGSTEALDSRAHISYLL